MQISRHNYETFFLLYVDKELSTAERRAVDVFVQENPDLQIELALLQDTVMSTDDIKLDKKDWLYREEEITALQENLLLYADEELSATDKKAVEFLLTIDKSARAEWAVLQQTKLQPDMAVVFADKQSLYKKEGGRVVGITWWRVAAAAVLLGFGLWTGVAVYKNNYTVKTNLEELTNKNDTKKQQQISDTNTNVIAVPEEIKIDNNAASIAVQDNNRTIPSTNVQTAIEKKNNQNSIAPTKNVTVQNSNNKKPDNNLPQPSLQNINRNGSNETIVANVLTQNNTKMVSENNAAAVNINTKENLNNAVVANIYNSKADLNTTAMKVVNNTTADVENNDHYLNVVDDKDKRTSLGGFLRKAKRVIERTANVKTGEGIKIAGFEIALK